MSATTLMLTVEPGALDARSSWAEFESLAVQMSREVGLRALEATLADAQERLIDAVCGPRWAPVRGLAAPFGCPWCGMAEDFARKGRRTRPRKLHTAAGVVELVLWHVGCRGCGRVFAPLLIMLGLSGKRRTDRLSVDLAELASQVSFARAGQISAQLAGTGATPGQAHNAVADVAALLSGTDGTLGPAHPAPDVVAFDGTGTRAGARQERGRCASGPRPDRPFWAGGSAPGAYPPTRVECRGGLLRDDRAAPRATRPGAGRARW
jgi:hypothetical protein